MVQLKTEYQIPPFKLALGYNRECSFDSWLSLQWKGSIALEYIYAACFVGVLTISRETLFDSGQSHVSGRESGWPFLLLEKCMRTARLLRTTVEAQGCKRRRDLHSVSGRTDKDPDVSGQDLAERRSRCMQEFTKD